MPMVLDRLGMPVGDLSGSASTKTTSGMELTEYSDVQMGRNGVQMDYIRFVAIYVHCLCLARSRTANGAMFSNNSRLTVNGGTFYTNHISEQVPTLLDYVAYGAMHESWKSHSPPKCHPQTRMEIQEQIIDWATLDNFDSFLFWLTGAAGAGKTAIAHSITELLRKQGKIAGNFFFTRSNPHFSKIDRLAPTLAYQLSESVPAIASHIKEAFEDRSVVHLPLRLQLKKLIFEPLRRAGHSNSCIASVFVVDGLDECDGEDNQMEIISLFSEMILEYGASIKVVIASRPHLHIQNAFDKCIHYVPVSDLSKDMDSPEDISLFLTDTFSAIRESHPFRLYLPNIWPHPDAIDTILSRSSGHFIYASTVIKYVESIRHNPATRLDTILGISPRPPNHNPLASLDELYIHILSNAEHPDLALRIITCLSALQGFSAVYDILFTPPVFDKIFQLQAGEAQMALIDLVSLLAFDEHDQGIQVLHASFTDFLLDETRAGKFFIGDLIPAARAFLVRAFLRMGSTAYPLHVTPDSFRLTWCIGQSKMYLDLILFNVRLVSDLDEIADDLLHFDFASFCHIHHRENVTEILDNYCHFVRSFSRGRSEKIQHVYQHHCSNIDRLLHRHLPMYFSDTRLTPLLVYALHLCQHSWKRASEEYRHIIGPESPDSDMLELDTSSGLAERHLYIVKFISDASRAGDDLQLKEQHYIEFAAALCDFWRTSVMGASNQLRGFDKLRHQRSEAVTVLIMLTGSFTPAVLAFLEENKTTLQHWLSHLDYDGHNYVSYHLEDAIAFSKAEVEKLVDQIIKNYPTVNLQFTPCVPRPPSRDYHADYLFTPRM